MKQSIKDLLKYFLFARHKYGDGIENAFVYELVNKVFNSKGNKNNFSLIKKVIRDMFNDHSTMNRNNLGAGDKVSEIRVSSFVKKSSITPKYGKLLYNLILYYKPKTILELGTAAGISSIYFSLANPSANIISIEGCQQTAKLAQNNFSKLGIKNITLINASFDDVLPQVLNQIKNVDFIFFDGNHAYEPTLRYFNQCLSFANENSIFVFDDIYWSDEMKKAWAQIKNNDMVSISVDIYRMGLIFFKKNIQKQNFIIRY